MIFWLLVIGAVLFALVAGVVTYKTEHKKYEASRKSAFKEAVEVGFGGLGMGAVAVAVGTFFLYMFSFGPWTEFKEVRVQEYKMVQGSEIKQIDDYEFTFVIESEGVESEKTFTSTEFKVRGTEHITVTSYDRLSPITLPWVVNTVHFVEVTD